MRSSVLFWYWCISQRAGIPSWYLQGLFSPLAEGLPPTVGLMWPASSLDVKGPISAAICISNWVGDDLGDLPATSSPFSCAFPPLSLPVREIYPLRVSPAGDPSSSQPLVLFSFSPSEMEQQPIRGCDSLFKATHGLFISKLMNSLFWIEVFLEKWQRSGAKLHIFWRGRTGSLKRLWGGQVGTILPSAKGLNNMGSFKMFTGTGIIAQCTRKKSKFRLCLSLSSTNFYTG